MHHSPDHYAVMGHPINHSLSPRIHQQFARQTDQHLEYTAILVPMNGLGPAILEFRRSGGCGLNITVPFKEEAFTLANELSLRARKAGAVNTLCFNPNDGLFGDNTDGVGLLTDLTQNLGLALKNLRILIVGAGGAARGIIGPLLAQEPGILVLANRAPQRSARLAEDFKESQRLELKPLHTLDDEPPFDLIINATSASLTGTALDLPDTLIASQTVVYDLVYSAQPTPFMVWAMNQGARQASDGLGMLVEQAAEAFFLWRHVRPDTGPVISDLRSYLTSPHT